MIICEVMGGISKKPPEYTYTGRSEFQSDGAGNWKIRFLSSGELTFSKPNSAKNVDLFAVGPGRNGAEGRLWENVPGGQGGKCITKSGVRLTKKVYTITIGGGQTATKMENVIVAGPGGDGLGTGEFGESNTELYGKNGPGGRYTSGFDFDGQPGRPNSGDGGGGGNHGPAPSGGYKAGSGGAGATGILIMRNKRGA